MHKTKAIIRVNISRTDTRAPRQYRMIEDVYKQLVQDFDACIKAGRPQPSPHTYTVWDDDAPIGVCLSLDLSHVRSVEKVT
jgi:hypothetical protein